MLLKIDIQSCGTGQTLEGVADEVLESSSTEVYRIWLDTAPSHLICLALRQTPKILYNLKLILWLFFSYSVPEFKFWLIIEQIAKFMSSSDYGVDYGFRYFLLFLRCLPTYRNVNIYLAMLLIFFLSYEKKKKFFQGLWTSFSEEN